MKTLVIILLLLVPVTVLLFNAYSYPLLSGLSPGFLIIFVIILLAVGEEAEKRKKNEWLAASIPASATIKAIRDTKSRVNGEFVFCFLLEVTLNDSSYKTKCESRVPKVAVGTVALNSEVFVGVDPQNKQRVMIDWDKTLVPIYF